MVLIPGRKRPHRPDHALLAFNTRSPLGAEYWRADLGAVEGVRISETVAQLAICRTLIKSFYPAPMEVPAGALEIWWTPTLTILSRLKGRLHSIRLQKEVARSKTTRLLEDLLQKTSPRIQQPNRLTHLRRLRRSLESLRSSRRIS